MLWSLCWDVAASNAKRQWCGSCVGMSACNANRQWRGVYIGILPLAMPKGSGVVFLLGSTSLFPGKASVSGLLSIHLFIDFPAGWKQ